MNSSAWLHRVGRFATLLALYTSTVSGALIGAFLLRFDFRVPEEYWPRLWNSILWIIPLKLSLLLAFGQFRSLLSYFSLPDAQRIGAAMVVSGVVESGVWFFSGGEQVIPRGVIVSDILLSFLAISALRTALRIYRERFLSQKTSRAGSKRRRTAIAGAGVTGAALLREIQRSRGIGMDVVCLIDDDRSKIGGSVHGIPILGPISRLDSIAKSLSLQKLVIAMPSAKPAVLRQLVDSANLADLEHDLLPSTDQILHRRVTVSHLRRVSPEDLLGREPVSLDDDSILESLRGRVAMVTGAGGSIGSELCRQIALRNPARLVLLERSEPALYNIQQELARDFANIKTVPIAASVCNPGSMNSVFRAERPDCVFHAAAHKHVPLMEAQPAEAIINNCLGTLYVAEAALRHGSERFVLISTDKAVNPCNVMGATKRLAEMIVSSLHASKTGPTRFCAVRFGNVLGSSGSVVQHFRQQIAAGGPVTVTHPDILRYFMSIPEAVGLVLQSGALSNGGEIFVLDMGEPVRIHDLARQMIELHGYTPEEDIEIHYIGLRPGEKLFEEPIHHMENICATPHPKVLRLERADGTAGIRESLREVMPRLSTESTESLKYWLSSIVTEYNPDIKKA